MEKTNMNMNAQEVVERVELDSFENIMQYIENGKTRGSFASYEQDTDILRKDSLYIDVREFFTEYNDYNSHLDMSQLKELLSQGLWNETEFDNTYNYNGSIQRDFTIRVFESEEIDEVVAFFSIHYGLDARVGYTESFAMRFEDRYSLDEFLTDEYIVASIEFETEGETATADIRANAVSEYIAIDLCTDEIDIFDDGSYLSLYDKDELREDFEEWLKDNDIEYKKDSIVIKA